MSENARTFRENVAEGLDTAKNLVRELEDAQTPADDEVLTKVGRVVARIAPAHPGEVRLFVRGGSEDYLAVAENANEAFDVNDSVVVVGLHVPRTVIVKRQS